MFNCFTSHPVAGHACLTHLNHADHADHLPTTIDISLASFTVPTSSAANLTCPPYDRSRHWEVLRKYWRAPLTVEIHLSTHSTGRVQLELGQLGVEPGGTGHVAGLASLYPVSCLEVPAKGVGPSMVTPLKVLCFCWDPPVGVPSGSQVDY